MNCVDDEFTFPTGSENSLDKTSIVVAPEADGVKVAVYTVELVEAKLVNDPPVTVISPTTKSVVASLDVNVNAIELSFDVAPELTSAAVIAIVGSVLSKVTLPEPDVTAVPALPDKSLNAMLYITDPFVSEAFAV